MLHGVQHFGSKGASYAVSTEVKDTTDGCSVVKTIGLVRSRKWQGFFYCFSVQFYRPACLVRKKKKYKLASLINGPTSWKGLGYIPLGSSGSGSVIQDLSGSWCIKGTDESVAKVD